MPWYDPRKVNAHGSSTAKVFLMNEAPGPREVVSGFPSFGEQGGNIYRILWRTNISWSKNFNNNRYYSWLKFCDDHYQNTAGKRKTILRKEFLELRRAHITCSNAFDRWPKSSENANDWVAPDFKSIQSKENMERIRSEIAFTHEVLLICGSCAWQAVFCQKLKSANAQIGRALTDDELLRANEILEANFKLAFYMGHTSKWGKQVYEKKVDTVFDKIRSYLDPDFR